MRGSLYIGGIEIEVQAPQGALEELLTDRYSYFLGATEHPVCRLHLSDRGPDVTLPNPPFAEVIRDGHHVIRLQHPDFEGEIDLDGEGKVSTAADAYTVDHILRILLAVLAPRHNAVMLHSCGVISGEVANVFAGVSGAGKSTLASLAGDRPILSDEHVIVQRRRDGWVATSTPFWGSYAVPGPARYAPIRRLWSLVQAPTNDVVPLDAGDALVVVMANAVLPSPDPEFKHAVFAVAAEMVEVVPAAQLHFVPTPKIWEDIDAVAIA